MFIKKYYYKQINYNYISRYVPIVVDVLDYRSRFPHAGKKNISYDETFFYSDSTSSQPITILLFWMQVVDTHALGATALMTDLNRRVPVFA